MLKKQLPWLISGLLLFALVAQPAQAGQQGTTVEKIKSQVAKIGVGEKARATVTKKDGTKTKGYIARADEDEFVIRDRKTDAATTIRYSEVTKVEHNRGHSTAKHTAIGVAIGVGAVIGTLLIIFARLDN
jgi:hypothetical protein